MLSRNNGPRRPSTVEDVAVAQWEAEGGLVVPEPEVRQVEHGDPTGGNFGGSDRPPSRVMGMWSNIA